MLSLSGQFDKKCSSAHVFLTWASVLVQDFLILIAVVPLELTAIGENIHYLLQKLIWSHYVHRLPAPSNLTEMPNKRTH